MKKSRILPLLLLVPFVIGFNAKTLRWDISKADPTLWVRFCETPDFESSYFPEGDPLHHQENLTFLMVVNSVFDDINSIETSYVRLELYPSDETEQAKIPHGRTIDVCFENLYMAAGRAGWILEDGKVKGCEIELEPKLKGEPVIFAHTLGHEIGHCLGLMHAQDTVHSIMSYFSSKATLRYQPDDKMGLTYLYPASKSHGDEGNTFGLSCGVRE